MEAVPERARGRFSTAVISIANLELQPLLNPKRSAAGRGLSGPVLLELAVLAFKI